MARELAAPFEVRQDRALFPADADALQLQMLIGFAPSGMSVCVPSTLLITPRVPADLTLMPHDVLPNALDHRRPASSPAELGVRAVGEVALAVTWRMLQAHVREPFLVSPPAQRRRLYYTTDDGWQCPLHVVPARPGTAGEPVLLVHSLSSGAEDFELGSQGLARALSQAGFAVYLFEHRGDRHAIAPAATLPFSADDLASHDLTAALDAVRHDTGFARVLVIGHGFGAQLLLLRLALHGRDDVAAGIFLSGALRFDAPSSATLSWGQVAALLPARWAIPIRRAQQLSIPFVGSGADLGSPMTAGPLARAHLRHASADLHVGVLRQVALWVSRGRLTDATGRLDVALGLPCLPTLVIAPDADPNCPMGSASLPDGRDNSHFVQLRGGWGTLDPLLGDDAPRQVFEPITQFLEAHRRACW